MSKNYCCKDCGGLIGKNSALYGEGRCSACFHKTQMAIHQTCSICHGYIHRQNKNGICVRCNKHKSLNPNFKDGRSIKKSYCVDCNKLLSDYRTKRCRKCADKHLGMSNQGRRGLVRYGEANPNWRGGLSSEIYPAIFCKELKNLIRARDHHCCQNCGISEGQNHKQLSVHHIDYNKKNNLPHNLISLCVKCHSKTNGDRSFWEKKCKEMLSRPQAVSFDLLLHDIKNLVTVLKEFPTKPNDELRIAMGNGLVALGDQLYLHANQLITETKVNNGYLS